MCEIIEFLSFGMIIGWVEVFSKEFLDNLENVVFRKDKFLVIKFYNCFN